MSDGPFKNLKLGKRWKRFAEAVQNVAFDSAECCALASDALVHEILTGDVPACQPPGLFASAAAKVIFHFSNQRAFC
jgi:hypothetical protein